MAGKSDELVESDIRSLRTDPRLKLTDLDYTFLIFGTFFSRADVLTDDFLSKYDEDITSLQPHDLMIRDFDEELAEARQKWLQAGNEIRRKEYPRIRAKLACLELMALASLQSRVDLIKLTPRYLGCPVILSWIGELRADADFAEYRGKHDEREKAADWLDKIAKAVRGDRRIKRLEHHAGQLVKQCRVLSSLITQMRTAPNKKVTEQIWQASSKFANIPPDFKNPILNTKKKAKTLALEILDSTILFSDPKAYYHTVRDWSYYLRDFSHTDATKAKVGQYIGFRNNLPELIHMVDYWSDLEKVSFSNEPR